MIPNCKFTDLQNWKYCIVCLLSWMYVYSRVSYRASIDIRDWPMIFCPCEFSLWWRVTNIMLLQHGHHSFFICYMLRFFFTIASDFSKSRDSPCIACMQHFATSLPTIPPKTHPDAIAPSILKACRAQSIIHSHRMSNLFLTCHTHRCKPALHGRADTPI